MRLIAFWTLFKRESLRYVRNWKSTLVPPLVTNSLYIIVFGGILGSRIREIQGFSYIDFILPGLILLGAALNAFENSSFSLFHSRWDRYIEEVLTSPMSYWEMFVAYVSASAVRGVAAGIGIWIVALLFTSLTIYSLFYFAAFMILSTSLFAALGTVVGLWADEWGDLSAFSNFLITPLVFLGGVFYSLEMLPGIWKTVSYLNPMTYMINGLRYGLIGYSDIAPLVSLGVLFGMTAVAFAVDIYLFRKGYGLQS